MPALQWFCRRWRTGSDDFTWSSLGLGVPSITGGFLALAYEDSGISGCPIATQIFSASFHGLAISSIIAGFLLVVLALCSARGKIFDVKQRALVPYVLYIVSAGLICQFILACCTASRAIYHSEIDACPQLSTRVMIRAVLALCFFTPCVFSVLLAISFDPSGRKKFDTEEEYHQLWEERCNVLCCCHANHTAGQEAFSEAAKTLAVIFRGYDLVPSDIAAGMLLLQGYQTYQRYRRVRTSIAFPKDPQGRPEVVSSQARYAHHINAEQRLILDRVSYFSKYYLGAYGWLLYTFMHCVTGLPRLWATDCIMCCRKRRHQGIEYTEMCGCDTTALKKVTGLSNDDIILTSFENTIYRPCFYVALDRPSNSVVIAIRGTMSLEDCITDMVATPAEVVLDAVTGERGFVHSGMLQSANNILQMLVKDDIVNQMTHGRFKDSQIVVLGHSLGAGTASILSILLYSRFPELRSRFQCIAYAPPGGLLSESTRKFCKSFIIGTVVGFDVIPRMSAQNFDHLRDSILAVLTHTNAPKAAVFCLCCCPSILGEKLPEFNPEDLNNDKMRMLKRVISQGVPVNGIASPTSPHSASSPDASPTNGSLPLLYPPLTMIHYVKMMRQAKSSCCCCLSEDGGLWTRLVTDEVWCPIFINPDELNFVLCHPMMTLDHFPDRVFDVIGSSQQRLQNGELDRFFSTSTHAEQVLDTTLHPQVFVPSGGIPPTTSAYKSV